MREPTAFERRVWSAVQNIRWGQAKTYGDIAEEVGSSPVAVGAAIGRLNKFPDVKAIVPWHRVAALGPGEEYTVPVGKRGREQVRLLLLEGHMMELQGKIYILKG